MKVLFIEDQENFAYLVKEMLSSIRDMPVTFEWANSLAGGIARAIDGAPDVILLDLSLPDSDGLDTLNRLHQCAGAAPIIVLTGAADEELAIKAIGQGAQDYLLKGTFDRRTLVRAMRYAVERKKSDQRLERQRQRQGALHDINVAMTSTLDLTTLINHLLDNIARLFPDAATTLSVINRDTGRLESVACRNVDESSWRGHEPELCAGDEMAAAAEPMVIEDCRLDLRIRSLEFIALHQFASYVGVPLRVHGQLLGALGVFAKQAHAFSGEEIEFFNALGNLAAMAIHNARLYAGIDNKSKKLSALFTVAAAANQSLETESFLQEVIRKITDIFGFEAMRVCLFDAHGEILHVRAIYQRHPGVSTISQSFRKGQGITGTVGASGEAMIISNLDTDPRYRELSHSQSAAKTGKKFLAGFPIKYQDQTLGVIMCVGQTPRELDDDEIQLITSMSNQIGVAVRNARLYAEVEQKTQELRALFDVTSAASQSLDARQILGEVAQRITEIFDFDATRAFLFDEPKEELHAVASFAASAEFTDGPHAFKKGQGITGTVGVTGETLIVSDFHSAPVAKILAQRLPLPETSHVHNFVGAFPIKCKEDTLGVITCLGRAARQLSVHEILLITAMARQIAVALQNARYYEQSKKQAAQLRSYALRQESVLEQERTRISREIHDELGQSLTALKLELSLACAKIDYDTSAFKARLGEITGLLDDTIHSVRKIASQLRPDILDKLGLIPAIEWQLQDFRRRTGIRSRFASNLTELNLSDEQATTLFRILQESLTNVARHARAKRVIGFLELQEDQITLRVEDNGVGIAASKIVDLNSLGLLGMQERAAALGGSVTVSRRRPRGTTVLVTLPLHSPALGARRREVLQETV